MEHDCIRDGCQYEGSLFCIWCGLTADDTACSPDCDGCCASDTVACHRGGCDMCDPPYYEEYDYDAQHAHFEKFGRPAFPNEY